MTKKLLFSCVCFLLCAMTAKAAAVSITGQGGWFESAYVTWQKTAGLAYNVYVSPANSNKWTKLDDELVREYPAYGRADALGLMAGSYQFKVVPVSGDSEVAADAAVSSAVEVKAHDRSGFAHVGMSGGIGAYKNDGTLKQGAKVLYVWADNAKTVTHDVVTNNKGAITRGQGLQHIITLYQKGFDTTPLAIRIIGTIKDADMDGFDSSEEGLQVKGKSAYSEMPITIEGVGNDAAIWGFGILCRNCKGTEFRNFAIMLCMDDALSIDTDNSNVWVHNMDFFYGQRGSAPDQVKGDGTIDIKGDSKYITVSYNHLYDSGKASLCGMKSESGPNWITYHHNWFDHSDSRHPRIRTMSVHVYNNYFDGNSKYGVGTAYQSEAFVENNYFRNCKYPMLSSMQGSDIATDPDGTFSGEDGGIIKSFGNTIVGARSVVTYQQNKTEFDCWEASSRNDQVPATVVAKKGGKTYSNFDTNPSIMYSYTPDNANDVPSIVMGSAGRMQHGDFTWTFGNNVEDNNYDVISELKTALEKYKSSLIGFFGGATIGNSSDASAEFMVNGNKIVMSGNAYTLNVAYDAADQAGYTVTVTPAEGATVAAVTGASGSNVNYTIAAPAPGQTATATFRILAENKANTRSYTINIVKAADSNADPGNEDDNDSEILFFEGKKLSNTTFYKSSPAQLQFKTQYGSETYKGITSGVSWEPKSEEIITFTTTKAATLKIVYGAQSKNRDIKLDGTATTKTEIAISAGAHRLEKASASVEIFFIDVIYADDVLRGDADGNGKVEPADILALANHLIGKTPAQFNAKAADVNKDGKVDITDLVALIKKLIP